jgi:hypothetical protein
MQMDGYITAARYHPEICVGSEFELFLKTAPSNSEEAGCLVQCKLIEAGDQFEK